MIIPPFYSTPTTTSSSTTTRRSPDGDRAADHGLQQSGDAMSISSHRSWRASRDRQLPIYQGSTLEVTRVRTSSGSAATVMTVFGRHSRFGILRRGAQAGGGASKRRARRDGSYLQPRRRSGAIKEARRALSQISTSDRIRRRQAYVAAARRCSAIWPRRRNRAAAAAVAGRAGRGPPRAGQALRSGLADGGIIQGDGMSGSLPRAASAPDLLACLLDRDCVRRCCMRRPATIADTVTSVFRLERHASEAAVAIRGRGELVHDRDSQASSTKCPARS